MSDHTCLPLFVAGLVAALAYVFILGLVLTPVILSFFSI